MENKKKIIMFDFDGVLADTQSFSYEIHKIKNPNFTWEHWQDFSNGNFHDGIEKAIEDGLHLPSDDFRSQYILKLNEKELHQVFDDSIKKLAEKYILTIVSSMDSPSIIEFFSKSNIQKHFSDILGSDVHRSKVHKIKILLKKYNTDPKDAVFITDTLGDIREANECNVPSIGVTWGLHNREHLQKGIPVSIIDDPRDLALTIENVLK